MMIELQPFQNQFDNFSNFSRLRKLIQKKLKESPKRIKATFEG